jgi:uncharacterized protein YaiI (UPF0178 family)
LILWLDGDAFTKQIRPVVSKAIEKRNVKSILVTNGSSKPPQGPWEIQIVESIPNAADELILTKVQRGDLVITRDIPLAAELLERGIATINDRGTEFDQEMIGQRKRDRDLKEELRKSGLKFKKQGDYTDNHKKAFADCFDRVLTRLLLIDKKRMIP